MSSPKYTPINRTSYKHKPDLDFRASRPEKATSSHEITSLNDNIRDSNEEDKTKLRQQLMEKDKIIFEYSKMLKETEKALENTKKLLHAKEETISQLKEEQREMKLQIKSEETILTKNEEEFHKFKHFAEEKILYLNKEKEAAENKLAEFTKLFESNQSDFQNTLIEYKKIEKQLGLIKVNFEEKENQIKSYEKIITEMRSENKQIPSLRKTIMSLENNIKELKGELVRENNKNKSLSIELQESERKFQSFKEETKVDKAMEKNFYKATFDLESFKKELNEKITENTTLSDQNKALVKENDKLVHYVTNEVLTLTNFLQTIPMGSKMKQMNSIPSFKKSNIGEYCLKYELLEKNFENLRTKIVENYNTTVTIVTKLERNIDDYDKSNKELLIENETKLKEIAVTKQKLTETFEKLDDLANEHSKLITSHNKLREIYIQTKQELEEKTKKLENQSIEAQLLIHNCYKKLKEKFPNIEYDCSSDDDTKTHPNENILYYLSILSDDHTKLNESKIKLIETTKALEAKIQKLEEEKGNLGKKFDRYTLSKDDELKKAEELKTEELKLQRSILYDKIKSLTSLLEESNHMISIYEEENRILKEKLEKLEHNHKMLTESHMELEQSINNNNNTLQILLEEKESKCNHLIREIELKEIQIDSLEKLIERKEDLVPTVKQGHTYTSTFIPYSNVNQTVEMPNDLNRQEDTEQDGVFKRNDQAEEELKKLIVNYESSASATKPNEAENKVAGRIYSFKKTKINN